MKKMLLATLFASLPYSLQAETINSDEQNMDKLDAITVTAIRSEMNQFNSPASVSVIDGESVQSQSKMGVNLSDALQGIPGLSASDRYNFAQDINLSTRGSRAGVRGVRLYVDGIPATMPDGQGVTSHIDLTSLGKIEVLKGPFSSLYGNSSAGTILVKTKAGNNPPSIESRVDGGSNGSWHYGLTAQGGEGKYTPSYVLSVNRFTTEGDREHSASRKNQVNFKLNWQLDNQSDLSLVFNHSDIKAQDPGSLTYAQWKENRRQVVSNVELFNIRKEVKQTQLGLNYHQKLDAKNQLNITAYLGNRSLEQYLAIPRITQTRNNGHAGGVIDFDRTYMGSDVHWQHDFSEKLSAIAGLAFDH